MSSRYVFTCDGCGSDTLDLRKSGWVAVKLEVTDFKDNPHPTMEPKTTHYCVICRDHVVLAL